MHRKQRQGALHGLLAQLPPAAITLVGEGKLQLPAVDNERCAGCGACKYMCPARPLAAIRVEGNAQHRRI